MHQNRSSRLAVRAPRSTRRPSTSASPATATRTAPRGLPTPAPPRRDCRGFGSRHDDVRSFAVQGVKLFDVIKRVARRLAARRRRQPRHVSPRIVSSSSPTPLASDVDTATIASTSCGGTDLRDDEEEEEEESSFESSRWCDRPSSSSTGTPASRVRPSARRSLVESLVSKRDEQLPRGPFSVRADPPTRAPVGWSNGRIVSGQPAPRRGRGSLADGRDRLGAELEPRPSSLSRVAIYRNFRERLRRRRRGREGRVDAPKAALLALGFCRSSPRMVRCTRATSRGVSRKFRTQCAQRNAACDSPPETSRPRRGSNRRPSRARRPAPPSSRAGACGETRVGTAPAAASPAGPPPHRRPSVRYPRRRPDTIPFLEGEPSFASPGKGNRRLSTRRRRRIRTPAPTAGKRRPRRAKPPPTRPPRRVNPRARRR